MQKRGQITLFIVIGIILLVLTIIIYSLVKNKVEEKSVTSEFVQPVKSYIEWCLEEQLREAVSLTSLQGGHYGIPPDSVEFGITGMDFTLFVPYYLDQETLNIPTKEDVENDISFALLRRVDDCLDLTSFEKYNYSVDKENIEFDVSLSKDKVVTTAHIPLSLNVGNTKEGKIIYFDTFKAGIDSNFATLLDFSSNFTNEQKQGENYVCLTCLSDMADANNLKVNSFELEKEDSYIIIYDLRDSQDGLVFNFAHKFDLSQGEKTASLENIETLEANVGEEFSYVVKTTGNNLKFSDNTDLFDINPSTGMILFTPLGSDEGIHLILLSVEDVNGNFDEELFTLQIIKPENIPQITEIPLLSAKAGESFSYTIGASSPLGLNLTFSEDSDLLEINSLTGIMGFTPGAEDLGLHNFIITVTDEQSNKNTQEVIIKIE